MGLNTSGYTLYIAGRTDRPNTCILARNMTIWMLPGVSCRDLVAVLVKYRVIHKSLQDFGALQYSSRYGHVEGENVNRGKDTPSLSYLTGAS
jgi:hypothetical protein